MGMSCDVGVAVLLGFLDDADRDVGESCAYPYEFEI